MVSNNIRRNIQVNSRANKPRGRAEALKLQVTNKAKSLYDAHFGTAQREPRGAVAELTILVKNIEESIKRQLSHDGE